MTGFQNLAPFACKPDESQGRLYPEPESATRTCFQRDRDRIIHCGAFRRLQYKTQVFVNHEGDFFRTRLTHSLEVSQIARSICRSLGLNEDLGEALALAHDLGHPPFGHAGEEALGAAMEAFGGFDHNAQSLRVVTKLEERYPNFAGLNLTRETLDGMIKHNGALAGERANRPPHADILAFAAEHGFAPDTFPGAEAQITALSDDIAYNNHDIEDGLRAELFAIDDLLDVPLVGPVFRDVARRHPEIDPARRIHEAVRDLIGAMVRDLLDETGRRIAALKPECADDVARAEKPVAAFSDVMREHDRVLKAFLFDNMYRHYRLNRMTSKARRVVDDLSRLFIDEPDCLPTEWRHRAAGAGSPRTARRVADYIAGMTDRYALDEHRRLFDVQARSS